MASFYTAADALIERNGEYLMIKEGKDHVRDKWNIPGGGVEHGENPVEAVKREVYEETGLKVTEVNGLMTVVNGNSSKEGHPVVVFVFSVEVEDGEPEPVLDEEVLDAEFKSENEIRKLELRNNIVEKALERRNNQKLSTEEFEEYSH